LAPVQDRADREAIALATLPVAPVRRRAGCDLSVRRGAPLPQEWDTAPGAVI